MNAQEEIRNRLESERNWHRMRVGIACELLEKYAGKTKDFTDSLTWEDEITEIARQRNEGAIPESEAYKKATAPIDCEDGRYIHCCNANIPGTCLRPQSELDAWLELCNKHGIRIKHFDGAVWLDGTPDADMRRVFIHEDDEVKLENILEREKEKDMRTHLEICRQYGIPVPGYDWDNHEGSI